MSNLKTHAERELKAAGFYDEDTMYGDMLPKAVLELLEVFSNQGHSGMSAGVTVQLFSKLAMFKPLAPVTGEPDEWIAVHGEGGKELYQNKRLTGLFKDGADSQPYYIDAIVWRGEEPHDTFTGTVEGITSKQYARLPFTPKTFYIDVYKDYDIDKYPPEEVVEGDTKYVYRLKDPKQLEEVFTYYIPF